MKPLMRSLSHAREIKNEKTKLSYIIHATRLFLSENNVTELKNALEWTE